MKEEQVRKAVREIIREEGSGIYNSDEVKAIVRSVFPNAKVERDKQDRIPIGTGEVVVLPNDMTFLVASDLSVFDENGRQSRASRVLELVLRNKT